jgi:uncharacterized protein YndB with AHSA1/START domain
VIDVTHQINASRRSVGARELEAGEARALTVSQVYDTDLEDLWDACTNAERIPRWFLPVSGDLRAGGHYRLEGNASGKIETCDRPNGFTATWEYDGQVSWIEVRLTAEGDGKARFELEHIVPADDKWDEFGPGAVGVGWDMGLMGLARYLSSGKANDPAEAMAWMVSEEGRQFATQSSERWYEASVAAGADPAEARAAADRTTAAYTAAPGGEAT